MICDVSDFRLEIAKELGFAVCNMNSGQFQSVAKDYFGKAMLLKGETADIDCFIDAAGAESILELFMEQGKIESRFVSVAVNNAIRNLDLLHMTYAQKKYYRFWWIYARRCVRCNAYYGIKRMGFGENHYP